MKHDEDERALIAEDRIVCHVRMEKGVQCIRIA